MQAQTSILGTSVLIDCYAANQEIEIEVPPTDYCEAYAEDCSGHGTCEPSDGSCSCDEGYTGLSCERCTDGYASLDGTCATVACTEDSCGTYGTCVDVAQDGAWVTSCQCQAGYTGWTMLRNFPISFPSSLSSASLSCHLRTQHAICHSHGGNAHQ